MYVYILECGNGKYYTGSTRDLKQRPESHYYGLGSNFTTKQKAHKLVYYEEFDRIDEAFNREKQIQKWSHGKKKALINKDLKLLKKLSKSKSKTRSKKS